MRNLLQKTTSFLLLTLLVLGFQPYLAHAQSTGTLSGTVLDTDSNQPLPGANVSLVGTTTGTITDNDGRYTLTLNAGTYEVQVSFVGYQSARATVTIQAGQTTSQDFSLGTDLIGAGEVVVLGTRRQGRTVTDSPVPVDVFTAEEIEATGVTETTQLLQQLIPSYNAPQASITDGSDHIRPATLRGLGPDQVLILVNGKRRHTGALVHVNGSVGRGSTGVDMNAIPSSAIERIEVLRDGAAAQYGSDAIAGVINLVLKDRTGLDASVNYGQHYSVVTRGYAESEGNLPGQDASTYNWDGNGVVGSPEDVTHTDGQTINLHLGYGLPLGNDGNLYISGSFQHREHVNRAGLDPRQQYYDGFTDDPAFSPTYTENTFPRLNHRYGNGEFDEFSLFVNGAVPVDDRGTQAYAFGGYSSREGLSGCFYRRSLDNRTNRSLYPNGFLPKINGKVKDFSAAGGLKGTIGDWAYDLSETFGTNSLTFDMDDTHNASMNNSPTSFDSGTLNFAQSTTNLDLFRSVGIGTASPLSIAVGGEFRWDHYWIDAGEEGSYVNGGIPVRDGPNAGASTAAGAQCLPGFQPRSEQDENRTNVAIYIDLENNITSQFLVSAAGRFENYSDFGSTLTGKLAARYEVTPEVAIRGAVSSGFRAPSLAQSWFTSIATNFIDGVPFEVGTFPVASDVARALGAEDLDPETSLNLSAGLTYTKDNLSLSVDAYQITIDDRITFTENFTSGEVADFLQGQGISANGGRYFTNALDTETQGLDIIGRYAFPAGPGTLRTTVAVNFTDTEITNATADDRILAPALLQALGEEELVGRVRQGDYEVAQPNNKLNVQLNYDVNEWRFMFRTNRYGEVTSLSADPTRDETFEAKFISDLEVAYSLQEGLSLAIGANNVFDVYPEKQAKRNSFNGIFPYDGFSPFGFFGRYVYSRVTLRM